MVPQFWLLRDKMFAMNDTVANVTLYLELGHVSMWWWQMMIQVGGGRGGGPACVHP